MDFKMKKTKMILATVAFSALFAACATTQPAGESTKSEAPTKDVKSKTHEVVIAETPESIFLKSLDGIKIEKVSSPKEVINGKDFSAPFVFSVKAADGSALANFPVTIEYPASKGPDGINFVKSNLLTDENGKVTFTADTTSFAAKEKIKAYPTPISDNAELLKQLDNYSAEAEWKVKSNIVTKGAALFIWDFNEKNRPENNSYNIQAEFRSRGITNVGNGPVNESSYIGKPQSLYKDTFSIIGTSVYGYLLFGTIKFEEPVTANEDGTGYYCVFKADIGALNMKNGSQVYSSVISYKSEGKNWNECVSKGKNKLAEFVVDSIVYGL